MSSSFWAEGGEGMTQAGQNLGLTLLSWRRGAEASPAMKTRDGAEDHGSFTKGGNRRCRKVRVGESVRGGSKIRNLRGPQRRHPVTTDLTVISHQLPSFRFPFFLTFLYFSLFPNFHSLSLLIPFAWTVTLPLCQASVTYRGLHNFKLLADSA